MEGGPASTLKLEVAVIGAGIAGLAAAAALKQCGHRVEVSMPESK
jgi:phytoene dehydrogenase-like protein